MAHDEAHGTRYGPVSRHLRNNAYGIVAIFIALGGTAIATTSAPKNTVVSKSIKNGQVKTKDLADSAVNSAKVADNAITGADVDEASLDGSVLQHRVDGTCAAGSSIREISAAGAVTCETDDEGAGGGGGGPPTGTAGGALAGTYPNPSIAPGAVGAPEIANGAVGAGELGTGSVAGGLGGTVQDGSITTEDIANGTVAQADLAVNPVAYGSLLGGLATGNDVSLGTVSGEDTTTGAIASSAILTPNVPITFRNLSVTQTDGAGNSVAPGPGNTRLIQLATASGGVATPTGVSCTLSPATFSCNSGGASTTVPAGSQIVYLITTIGAGVTGNALMIGVSGS